MRRSDDRDSFGKFIDRKKSDMQYTYEDAGREWLGMGQQAFYRRYRNNTFSLPEIRKILAKCNATTEEIVAIMRN